MKIQTPVFGEVEIKEEKIIRFDQGIPGFPDVNKFVFLDLPGTPFYIMQSVQSELYFFTVNPFEFFKEYEVNIPDPVIEKLGIQKGEDVLIYNIATLQGDLSQSTANLKAPIIVNAPARKGKQLVLNDSTYAVRQPIFTQPSPALSQAE